MNCAWPWPPRGLPGGGGIGFEIFDDQSWSTSRFVQEVNYRRALEGELARTITSIQEVEKARIHLVLAPDSPFVDIDQTRTKASVVLQIKGGSRLNPGQVQGIAYLVSSSVKGLKPEDVSVIDTDGNLLTGTNGQGDSLVAISSHQLEYKKLLEGDMERRVTRMLENVVGNGRAVVRVSAEVDFRRVEKEEELYDPDSVVIRSEQKKTEKVASPGGGNAVAANPGQPGVAGVQTAQGAPSEKKEQIYNYEISKVVRRMVESPGAVQRLSVAVLVHKTDEFPEGNLGQLESLVKGAIGYDEERGDQVEVALMPFGKTLPGTEEELPESGTALEKLERYLPYVLKYGGLFAALLLLVFTVFKPLLNSISEQGKQLTAIQRELPERLDQVEVQLPEKRTERDNMMEMIESDPMRAAQVMRMWLKEG